jgi:hypothetical protein
LGFGDLGIWGFGDLGIWGFGLSERMYGCDYNRWVANFSGKEFLAKAQSRKDKGVRKIFCVEKKAI